MERTISVEEKIRRAEEIYARRQEGTQKRTATVTVNNNNKKDIKLLKKMIIQIIISLLIYSIIYTIQNNNYIFSQDFINKANEILSTDMNFNSIYENIKNNIMKNIDNIKNKSVVNENEIDENITQTDNIEAIGGAVEEALTEQNTIVEDNNIQTPEEPQEVQLSQEEIEIDTIKKTANFIKPIEGTISSGFGQREPTTSTVPKNHTGVDIAANMGTKIKASTDGEVVLASEEGDYGKHLKIQIGSVSIIYAHCNNLYVNQGDKVIQGQEIAEVGSTGNSTGPHLHFEIRLSEKAIDPQKILEL